MFAQIFWFDFKRNLKRPSTWIFFSGLFLFVAVYIAAQGGLIFGIHREAVAYLNSARSCAFIINATANNSLIGTIILITIMAPAIQKDFQYNSHSIYFTKPISKFGYVAGRFTSGYLTALLVMVGPLLAFILMSSLPIYEAGKFGSYGVWNYLQGFVYFIIPNTFFVGTLFFFIVTYTRNMMVGYVVSVIFAMLNNDTIFPADLDNMIVSLKNPYGNAALYEITKNWTPEEENKLAIPFAGYFLYNRILWIVISGFLFLSTYFYFSFQYHSSKLSWIKKKKTDAIGDNITYSLKHLPIVSSIFDTGLSIKQCNSLTKLEFKNLIKSPLFILLILVPSILFFIDGSRKGALEHPTTLRMIDAVLNFFKVYINLVIVFYAGALVWRERNFKVEDIISSTPIKTWVLMFSKITSLVSMYILITLYFILFFILFQLSKGYTEIQLLVYFQYLFGYNLFNIIILVCFAVSMQGIVNNRYLGYLISAMVIFLIPVMLEKIGISNGLIRFNSGNKFIYSAMKGTDNSFLSFVTYKIYWLSFVGILLITANLMWSRGKEYNFRSRWRFAKNSFARIHLLAFLLGLGCMILFGSFL